MLQIPRITESYIQLGLKNLDQVALFKPDIGLNFHYPDCAFFALLMELKNPKHILDLGSYFGLLPILTEHLHSMYGEGKKFDWTLIDNCSYVKELADYIKGNGDFNGRFLNSKHLETWKVSNLTPWKKDMFELHGEYCVPPATPEEFYLFWEKFTSYYKMGNPKKEMYVSLNDIPSKKKFDLVMFDLAAEAYDNNLEMFNTLVNEHINEDAIIVMDDILPRHPRAMSMFYYIIDYTEFVPVAFSTNKIAIQRKQFKEEFIFNTTANSGLRAEGMAIQPYFNFYFHKSYKWGDYLNLRAN